MVYRRVGGNLRKGKRGTGGGRQDGLRDERERERERKYKRKKNTCAAKKRAENDKRRGGESESDGVCVY